MVEELNVLTDRVRVLTQGETTGGRYEVFEVRGAAGGGAPLHRHPWDEEFHVIEGAVDVLVGDSCQTCGVGDSLRVPGGVLHGFRVGPEGAKFLAVTSPTGASRLFRELHQASSKGQLTPAEVVHIASRHGVEVPPPPAG
jgi:quercetin dioxygenase-like cupin family protein